MAALATLAATAAGAQQVQRIAAIVNDDVISAYDLETRLDLVMFSTRLPNTPEVRQRIRPQVLRALIDERLQLQEAQRRNISVSQGEISQAFRSIERQNNLPRGGLDAFIKSNGIDREAMLAQVRAGIAWQKLLGQRIRPRISIGEDEIDEVLQRIKDRQGQSEYRLSEVVLTVESPDEEAAVRRTAERIVEQVREGANFAAIARQFSQSATAAVGGDLGWVHEAELEPEVGNAVAGVPSGALLPPIKTVYGYRLLLLRAKRRIAGPDISAVKLDLRQIFLPLPRSAPADAVESQISLARTIKSSASSCPDFARLATEVGSPRPPDLGRFDLKDLAPDIRNAIQDVPAGGVSEPVRLPDGVLLLMVCDREGKVVNAKLPDRDAIAEDILNRRMSLMSRRYLRDIRLSAVVDVRV